MPTAEFAYDSSINRFTSHRPIEVIQGFSLCQPIDLVPLPIDFRPTVSAQSFSDHICDLHDKIKRKKNGR